MRNLDGEAPRGPSGNEPERGRSPLDRPDWWRAQPKVPWYRQVSRKQLLWTIAAIVFIHVMAGIGFMQDVKQDPIDALRRHQKTYVNYALLPACPPSGVARALQPRAPLMPPPGISARGLTGSVGLGLQLSPDGRVADVCLQQGSIDAGFDVAVFAAARSWQFAPGMAGLNLVRVTFASPDAPARVEAYTAVAPAVKSPAAETPAAPGAVPVDSPPEPAAG